MKKFLLLLLVPFAIYAQNDSIKVTKPNFSIVGLNAMNVVYRGLSNPISVGVNNAKPFKISGDGVIQKEDGTYVVKPKSANTTKVLVEIQTTDSTKVIEEHTLRVKPLPMAALLVNQKGCFNGDCTIDMPFKELLKAEISIKLIDFMLDYDIKVLGFRLYVTNTKGETLASYDIEGNKIPEEVYSDISANDKANLIIIHKINFTSNLGLAIAKTPMIKIRKNKEVE